MQLYVVTSHNNGESALIWLFSLRMLRGMHYMYIIASLMMLSGSTLAGEKPFCVNLFCCEKPMEKPCKVHVFDL